MLHLFFTEKGSTKDIEAVILGYGAASNAPIFKTKSKYVNTHMGNSVPADIFHGLIVEDESGKKTVVDAIITGTSFWSSADGPFGVFKGKNTKLFASYRRDVLAYLDQKIALHDAIGYDTDNDVYAIYAAIAARDKGGFFMRKSFIVNVNRYKETCKWQVSKTANKVAGSADAFADTEDVSDIQNRILRLSKKTQGNSKSSNDDINIDEIIDDLDELNFV